MMTLVLVNLTKLEKFWQDFEEKTLVLVNPTELEIFWQDLFAQKSLPFGYSYSAEVQILQKISSFCKSYDSRNSLTRFVHIISTKAVLQLNWSHFTVVEIRWFLFVERLPDALAERLLAVSRPYMVKRVEKVKTDMTISKYFYAIISLFLETFSIFIL